MSDSVPPERGRRIASFVVLFVVGMQSLAGFLPVLIPVLDLDPKIWPFLKYGMYATPHPEGEVADRWMVMVELADGSETEMKGSDLDMNAFLFGDIHWAIKGDKIQRLRDFVADYERRKNVKVRKIRLDSRPFSIDRDGVHYHEHRILKSIDLESHR